MPAQRTPGPKRSKKSILSLSKDGAVILSPALSAAEGMDDVAALRRALLAWHRRHALKAPWRTSGDPYRVLVAAVMAQQTQISRVLLKFDEFITAFPTVQKLARARAARVLRVWAGMGYNLRALRLHRAAKLITRRGGFPRTAAELEHIEGIGPFTAAIISSFAFREPAAAVDTNVRRVIARLSGDVDVTASDRAVQPAANALISRRAPGRWNQAIMDLGGRVCISRSPKCDACPISRWCRSRPKLAKRTRKIGERRAGYKPQQPFAGSRRYHRGRIVQALRELPAGRSLSPRQLLRRIGGVSRAGRASANASLAGRASARQSKARRVGARQAEACPTEDRGGLSQARLAELLTALHRDGLIRRRADGRVSLP